LANKVHDRAQDEVNHGDTKACVEPSPEVEEALSGSEARLGQGIVLDEDLQASSCPTEALLVEVMDRLRGEA